MKPDLLERLVCPACGHDPLVLSSGSIFCASCRVEFPLVKGIPVFSPVPGNMVPFNKFERGPELGTRWRQANWRFLQQAAASLPPGAVILDVGAGRGDFAAIFKGCRYLALDLYPYDEVDLVADLARVTPIKASSLDVVILANVLEHVQEPAALLRTLCGLLQPGGLILATVPFLLKIHQSPFDFTRFTRFGLQELARQSGLQVLSLEGYYDPVFLMTEARQNLERYGLRGQPRSQRAAGRAALLVIHLLENLMEGIAGKGKTAALENEDSPAPVGYHVVFFRPGSQGGAV